MPYADPKSERALESARARKARYRARLRETNPPVARQTKEQKLAIRRAYYAANAEHIMEKMRSLPGHREYVATSAMNRRARKRDALVEVVHRSVVWERDEGVCHICQHPADESNWHLEHVIPLAQGGEHSYGNVAVSHPKCNLRKGSR